MIALDPIALRALVKVSGPVDVQGTHIDADNIVHEILLQQYVDYAKENPNADGDVPGEPSSAGSATATSPARSSTSSTRSAGTSPTSSTTCGRRPAAATCMFWSSKPEQQRAWKAAGRLRRPAARRLDGLDRQPRGEQARPVPARRPPTSPTTRSPAAPRSWSRSTSRTSRPTACPATSRARTPCPSSSPGEYKGILAVNVPFVSRDVHLDGVEQIVAAGPGPDDPGGRRQHRRSCGARPAPTRSASRCPKGYEHLAGRAERPVPGDRLHRRREAVEGRRPARARVVTAAGAVATPRAP